jgi:hypothetical protein
MMGNPIEGLRRSVGGSRRRPAESSCGEPLVRSCGHGGSEGGRERERALTPPWCFGGACSTAGSVKRQRGELGNGSELSGAIV